MLGVVGKGSPSSPGKKKKIKAEACDKSYVSASLERDSRDYVLSVRFVLSKYCNFSLAVG